MRMGVHAERLGAALQAADEVYVYAPPGLEWDAQATLAAIGGKLHLVQDTQRIVEALALRARPGDTILVMSNGGFENIHQRILDALAAGAAHE